jgi:ribose 5-phosphate isomerase A
VEQPELKKLAAERAVQFVEDGMIVGLGTGSTAEFAIRRLGALTKEGRSIKAIPTSQRAKKLAMELGIPLIDFDETVTLDVTIDGADEVDSNLNLIKGGGGALTREKIVAYHSKRQIIVVDESKIVKRLGADFPVPVEVVKFAWAATKKSLEELGCTAQLRTIMNEKYITDNGNYILDCDFGPINNPEALEKDINAIPGVVENGLFIGLVDEVIVGSRQGLMTLNCQPSAP